MLGLAGLLSVSVTIILVLRVMRPRQVSYDSIREAAPPTGLAGRLHGLVCRHTPYHHALQSPLYRWKEAVTRHPDLYLPCGVGTLDTLRQLLTIEEITLMALASARENAASDAVRSKLTDAQTARAARLHQLRSAAASIVAMGAFYRTRARSTQAMYGGVAFGLAGIIAIVAAAAWPLK